MVEIHSGDKLPGSILNKILCWNTKMNKRLTESYGQQDTKIMTMNRMHHPQSDNDGLYIVRMGVGRGFLSTAECVETEEQNLSLYLDQSEEKLLKLSKYEMILPE